MEQKFTLLKNNVDKEGLLEVAGLSLSRFEYSNVVGRNGAAPRSIHCVWMATPNSPATKDRLRK